MTAHLKMSQAEKIPKRYWLLWGVGVVLLLVFIGAFLAWHYRYDLLESKVKQVLAQNGFNAELEIKSADTHQMVIEGVVLSSGSQRVLTASRIKLEYNYKRALNGEFKRIVIVKPVVNLAFDKSGKIINDWFPKNASGNGYEFPAKGVSVEDGVVNWTSPFGHGLANMRVDAKSATHWNWTYDSPDTYLIKDGLSLRLDITGGVEQEKKNLVTSFGSITSKTLSMPALQMDSLKIDYNLDFNRAMSGEIDTNGLVKFGGEFLETEKYTAKVAALKLDLKTKFNPKSNTFENFSSRWKLQSENTALKNSSYRQQISERLTAYNTSQKTPIARHFSEVLPSKLARLLVDFSVQGQGEFRANNDGYKVSFTENFIIENQGQSVEVSPNSLDAIRYNARNNTVEFVGDVKWSGENAVHIFGLKMRGKSINGTRMDVLNSLNARVQSVELWQKEIDGYDLRLSPFDIDLNYVQNNGVRDIMVSGALRYDGIVPGGVVTNLQAEGVVKAHIGGDAAQEFTLGFAPKTAVQMDSFISTSGWQAKGVKFTLPTTKTLIVTTDMGREMRAGLQGLTAQIISPNQDRHMDINAQEIHLQTYITEFPKVWNLAILDAVLTSDDFPSPGTQIRSKSSQVVLEQSANGDLYFTTNNPNTFIETDNVQVESIDVKMTGTPERFEAVYAANAVALKGGDVPILPVTGTAIFDNGLLTGDAVANLLTGIGSEQHTPIEISFSSFEGRGHVNIDIESMNFTPTGLQPQFLVSSLKGKLAEVSGQASAHFELEFGGGEPIRSFGTTDLINLDMGTLVGPIRGVNTQLKFSSLFPLVTDGVQAATLAGFDPGFPLENGNIKFKIIPGGVGIDEASWPIENDLSTPADDGLVSIKPTIWKFGNVENLAIVDIENLELATLFEKLGRDKFVVTGKVSGTLPAKINGVDVRVDKGRLEVKDGGIIRFKTDAASAASQTNEYAGHGLKALENLTYQKMEVLIDGPLDGSVQLNVVAEGYNPEVLSGQKFLFDVGVEGELANIARNLSKSFSTQENIKRVLDLQSGAPE